MKRLINTLIVLMLTLIFIPNVYGEEYNYYEMDLSSKEAFEKFSTMNFESNNIYDNKDYVVFYIISVSGEIMGTQNEKDNKIYEFFYDKNGTLLLKMVFDENDSGFNISSYEVGDDAPDVIDYLFPADLKEHINSYSNIDENGEELHRPNLSVFKEYDGIRLRLREKVLEYTSDKTCTSVCINKVKMVNRTSRSITKDVPKFDGLEINFDLSFKEVNDEVNYEVNIYNPTDKDYEISTPESSTDKDFVKYDYKFENDDNVLKAKSNKTMYVSVRYNKEVDSSSFVDGVFKEEKKAVIKLSNGVEEAPVPIEIPDTYTGISIFIIFALVAGLGYISYNKLSGKMMLLFIPLLLIPVIVFAYERLEVKVNTNVEIEKPKLILMARQESQEIQVNIATYYSPEAYSPKLWDFTDSIASITFENKMREISEYAYKIDVSEKQDNSIIAYLVLDHENNKKNYYNAYIVADDTIYANPNSFRWFANMSSLKSINNMEYLDTSLVKNMEGMFSSCTQLKQIDLSHFDTTNVINMCGMFYGCINLTSIDLSSFNTNKVYDMSNMFYNTGRDSETFSLNLGNNFITTNTENMKNMFCRTGENSNYKHPSTFDPNVVECTR